MVRAGVEPIRHLLVSAASGGGRVGLKTLLNSNRHASVLTNLPDHIRTQEPPPAAAASRQHHEDEADPSPWEHEEMALQRSPRPLPEEQQQLLADPTQRAHTRRPLTVYDWRLRAISQRESHPGQMSRLRDVRVQGGSSSSSGLHRLLPGSAPELEAYRDKYMDLIKLEETELEKEASDRLAKTIPDPAEGLTLWDLRVVVNEDSLFVQDKMKKKGEKAVSLYSEHFDLPRHQFRVGMACWISDFTIGRANQPVSPQDAVMGHILRITSNRIDVAVKSKDVKKLPDQCRIDYAYDPTVILRMGEALDALTLDRTAQRLEQHRMDRWANYTPRDKRISIIQRGTDLVDFVAPAAGRTRGIPRLSNLFTDNQLIRSWAVRHSTTPPLMTMPGDPPLGTLNPIQVKAIALALQHRMTLIQGPPGTGKSETIANIVHLLKVHFQVACPILVCAPTNAAVDSLVSTLARKKLKVLRMGRPVRVRDDCVSYSYDSVQEQHPSYEDLVQARMDVDTAVVKLKKLGFRSFGPQSMAKKITPLNEVAALALIKELQDARKRAKQLGRTIASDVIQGSDVVLSTSYGGSERVLDQVDFPFVLVDEAAQCNEPSTLIPMMRGCKHAILIGDHKQLTGMNKSQEAAMKGFNNSLFERLIKQPAAASIMLQEQYRMTADIADFPNTEFYSSRLITSGQGHRPLKTAYLQPGRTVAFLHHSHIEAASARSLHNMGEGEIVLAVVNDLLRNNPDLRPSDIGVISPYAAQTSFIKDLRRRGVHDDVEVHTVDGFQGREKRAIVLSTVRSNSKRTIGFLQDPRRLNVALTRAKDAMIIIGNKDTLSASTERDTNDVWYRLMKWLENESLITTWDNNASTKPT